ncbi:hypothetical protein FRN29_23200 [Vibrio alginolyticus]|nr:hypothetical protein [Vibrio alginolyticus]
MCNAWNHRAGCNCGWGSGENSLTEHAISVNHFSFVPSIQNSIESYTNPNASCPVCGDSVFFYQSPSGGRVFFDLMEPPWPKHPCTDSSSRPLPLAKTSTVDVFSSEMDLKKEWKPYFISSVNVVDRMLLQLEGHLGDSPLSIYVRKYDLGKRSLTNQTIVYLKEYVPIDGCFDMSMLTELGRPKELEAFKFRSLAKS